MSFLSSTHEREFNSALARINKNNAELASAVYLLTADYQLWGRCRHSVNFNAMSIHRFGLVILPTGDELQQLPYQI